MADEDSFAIAAEGVENLEATRPRSPSDCRFNFALAFSFSAALALSALACSSACTKVAMGPKVLSAVAVGGSANQLQSALKSLSIATTSAVSASSFGCFSATKYARKTRSESSVDGFGGFATGVASDMRRSISAAAAAAAAAA